MKFSEKWLREWVNPAIGTQELMDQITMAGLEVDGFEPVAGEFTGVIVGEVRSVAPHPDADKLRVCQVAGGDEVVQVVCGALTSGKASRSVCGCGRCIARKFPDQGGQAAWPAFQWHALLRV